VGKRLIMSAPISAIRTSAVLRFTPGMLSKSSISSEKGAKFTRSISALNSPMDSSQVVDVGEDPSDHEGMVGVESSLQCFPKSRDLRA
jgi:hypothetical protein